MMRPRIKHPTAGIHYAYHLGRRFDPGARAEVFTPLFANPVYVFHGPGKIAGQFRVTQHPQVWFAPQIGRVGLPTQAGILRTAPLLDPSNI
jgi:lauroyl/myristoyl acyltransferase